MKNKNVLFEDDDIPISNSIVIFNKNKLLYQQIQKKMVSYNSDLYLDINNMIFICMGN